jgi:hypothetical protein
MSVWTAIVVIVAIVAMANIKIARMHARGDYSRRHFGPFARFNPDHGESSALPPRDQPVTGRERELESEVGELRDRIKVLERIATEEHQPQRLAAEIESLRDR